MILQHSLCNDPKIISKSNTDHILYYYKRVDPYIWTTLAPVLEGCSLLCGPSYPPVVNLEMFSTARFFDGNAIYGCSGLGNCRMLNKLCIAFCVIDLIKHAN